MRWLRAARAAYGAALLALPAPMCRLYAGHPTGAAPHVAARVLGARHLAQAALLAGGPRRQRAGAAVDGLHAASLVTLALVDRRNARLALTDAAVATLFGSLGLALAGRG
jgi:hypothetical protein